MKHGRKSAAGYIALGIIALIGVIAVIAALATSNGSKKKAGATGSTPSVVTTSPTVNDTPAPDTPSASLAASDLKITLKIKSKECFGDAGCDLVYEPSLTYVGTGLQPPDGKWEVTYQVTGGSDGPQIDTLTLQGTDVRFDQGVVQTPSASTVLRVKITDIERVY